MTEAEWMACEGEDTEDMQALLKSKGSDRKLRLFAVACCRRIEHLCSDRRSQWAIDVAELDADGEVAASHVSEVWRAAERVVDELLDLPEDQLADTTYYAALATLWCVMPFTPNWNASAVCSHAAFYAQRTADLITERKIQAKLLCDVLGPDFAVQGDPRWQTETVVALATGIYAERAFDRLPILADALEEAGCDHADILAHCRGNGPHVRGCWVVDLLLGMS